jgi:hypothetical protein
VGEPTGVAHAGKGGGAGQGGTGGDAPRRRCDEGAAKSARDGSVPVGGGSGDLRGPRQLQGGERRGEARLTLERGGVDPRLTGEGRSGDVGFKSGG